MKTNGNIPVSKVERAGKFMKTGIKVGGNYLKHYTKKAFDSTTTKEELHQANADDIYASLSELKGSALKVAQMMSMDRNMLPRAYAEKFQLSQFSAPPISGPLVVKTFRQAFDKSPQELFDRFNPKAANAASIGQVHEAWKGEQKLAVKVQYPGIADSVKSDLRMVKPFAVRIVGLNEADVDKYMQEVETKLIEETDYTLELKRSQEITQACSHIKDIYFPVYYPELSSKKILTMDWIDGMHLGEFIATNPSQEVRNRIGQALWDFYDFQIHTLRQVHADPHPGNFLLKEDGTLGIIDFGCVKELVEPFYTNYFSLINTQALNDRSIVDPIFTTLEFIHPKDSPEDVEFYTELFLSMTELLGRPFFSEEFDFGDDVYFDSVYQFAEKLSGMKKLRDSKVARGLKDSLYINRTYYGLYSMLNQLKAKVNTHLGFKSAKIVS
jgi:predicted unusual protein kinase regulating ubiquinone biosynthesis (AarF/ABC1/UbiB family)